MGELQLTLSDEERQFLQGLLENVLKEALVEEHRTRKLSYRKHVVDQEKTISAILSKLGKRPEVPAGAH